MNEELNSKAQEILSTLGDDIVLPKISPEDADFYDTIAEKLGPSVAELFSLRAKRRIVLEVAEGVTPESTGTYIGGHPFVNADEDFSWPVNEETGKPLAFLMQVNFAELPKLEGFPEEGLLQWWILGDDDVFGLSFDKDKTGREGLFVKFYSAEELLKPAAKANDPIPNEVDVDELGPLFGTEPFALTSKVTLSFPSYEDSTIEDEELQLFSDAREILDESEDGDRSIVDRFMESDTQVGGYPSFVQGDSRYGNDRPKDVILQLESIFSINQEILMWGDSGNAQLFGDPEALKRGDTSSLWWDWACY